MPPASRPTGAMSRFKRMSEAPQALTQTPADARQSLEKRDVDKEFYPYTGIFGRAWRFRFSRNLPDGTGTIDAVGVNGKTIYVGDSTGNIFVTNNDGASWVQRNIPTVTDHINDFFLMSQTMSHVPVG